MSVLSHLIDQLFQCRVLSFLIIDDALAALNEWLHLCSDSEAAEGAAGRARADPEGAAGEQQAAATGVRPPGGAREGESQIDGGGTSPAAAAGTEDQIYLLMLVLILSNILSPVLCTGADCRWCVALQTAGEGVPAVQGTAERQTRVQTAVRDEPAHPGEGRLQL